MLRFLTRRTIGGLLTLLASSVLTYALIFLSPSDPATMIVAARLGPQASEEQIRAVRESLGLDQPVIVQYAIWLSNVARGDLGRSIRTGQPISSEIGLRLGPTLWLALAATGLSVLIGLPFGVLASQRSGRLADRIVRLASMLAVSTPDFWLAFVLIVLLSVQWRLFPTYGMTQPSSIVLPAITLAFFRSAYLMRFTRSQLNAIRGEDFLRTARGKGLSEPRIWWRHALPNVGVPLVTMIAQQFASSLTGAIIVETVFAWPGVGSYYLEAVRFRDLPVIQAGVLLFALAFLLVNLTVDLTYALLDPKVRVTS